MILPLHDLSVIRYTADRTAVMNNGSIVEINDTEKIYFKPQHSYTKINFCNDLTSSIKI